MNAPADRERLAYAEETMELAEQNVRDLWRPWRWRKVLRMYRQIEERIAYQRTWPK